MTNSTFLDSFFGQLGVSNEMKFEFRIVFFNYVVSMYFCTVIILLLDDIAAYFVYSNSLVKKTLLPTNDFVSVIINSKVTITQFRH